MYKYDVKKYWQERYKTGGNSGSGSYNRLAKFKADFLNRFYLENSCKSVLELGCGDGNQNAMFNFEDYVGVDISPKAIEINIEKYKHDARKTFYTYEELYKLEKSFDICLSLDVIYHLSDDEIFTKYIDDLFSRSKKYVIIYSNDTNMYHGGVKEDAGYLRFRQFTKYIKENFKEFRLIDIKANEYPFTQINPVNTSIADFFVYQKIDKEVDEYKVFQKYFAEKNLSYHKIVSENFYTLDKKVQENYEYLGKYARGSNNKIGTLLEGNREIQEILSLINENTNKLIESSVTLEEQLEIEEVRNELVKAEETLIETSNELAETKAALMTTRNEMQSLISKNEKILEELLNEKTKVNNLIKEYETMFNESNKNLKESVDRYNALANSKLGRIQVNYWRKK